MKSITVFTPTYNRAYCLHQCYESLIAQTNKDFIWLVIDDGSTDGTKALVNGWISEEKISIRYHYQDNLGMHGGHNTAYSLITTPLNVCIDSDDFMPADAIEKILKKWNKNTDTKIAGIVALDGDKNGEIIGSKMPVGLYKTTLNNLYFKHKVKGDKKLIYKTDVVKKYPLYPIFEGEKFVPLGSLYLMIDQEYELLVLNEIVCVVEYLEDGSSLNIFKQYRRHPNGFLYSRKVAINYGVSFKRKFKNAIHLVSTNLQLRKINLIDESPNKPLALLAIPFGILLYLYIRIKAGAEV